MSKVINRIKAQLPRRASAPLHIDIERVRQLSVLSVAQQDMARRQQVRDLDGDV